MPAGCLLCYISDRSAFDGDEFARRKQLLDNIFEAVHAGVDYIQLREKDLPTCELESLAREAIALLKHLRTESPELRTKLLINSRTDVALAIGAHGVHLRSVDISPSEIKAIWKSSFPAEPLPRDTEELEPVIASSCHTPEDVKKAAEDGADFAVFGPVFQKKESTPTGLNQLREACRVSIPVLALGGITLENAQSCLEAGAAGIAAIRLFQENEIREVVQELKKPKRQTEID